MDGFFILAIGAVVVLAGVLILISKKKEDKSYLKVPKEDAVAAVPILLGESHIYGIPNTVFIGKEAAIDSGVVVFKIRMRPSPVEEVTIPLHHFNFNPDLAKPEVLYEVAPVTPDLGVVLESGELILRLTAVPTVPSDVDKVLAHIKKCLHI